MLTINVDINDFGIRRPVKYFCHQHTKYVWIIENQVFCSLGQLIWKYKTCEEFANNNNGLSEENYNEM